ncbi:cytochrome c-type biogenesis protein CcmH [Yersinia nurmii]|uniref:Cytochrome c-type biogenesis protein n=1 Tax=Yersinia nurmii TaxID=685706 RepID=A0AAW7K895_9GAMM|nr:cytochrome c-type biogenesis protein [Yersinia nurmii]MDN0087165.1 cytochrome c-type biogenesis protein CcmH [Yersinia nurmii]CNE10399.1 putative cytochrome c-type biogenesis protein [Yersinia nurmii]
MRLISLVLGMLLSWAAFAAIDTYQFSSVQQEQQYRELTEQLRCPKCQNNSIADSNAIIAADMRNKVYELMRQGKTKPEIIDYMVARYGNFVTYEPPVTAATLILWVGPALFVLIGGAVVILRGRRRNQMLAEHELPEQERQRLAVILAQNEAENRNLANTDGKQP